MAEAPLTPAQKLQLAFELFEAGREMKRQQLRREFPELGEAEIASKLAAWVSTRPGAEHGDAVGTPRPPQEPAA